MVKYQQCTLAKCIEIRSKPSREKENHKKPVDLFLGRLISGRFFSGGLFPGGIISIPHFNKVVDYLFSADVEKQLADTELITTEQNSRLDEIMQELTIIKVFVLLQQTLELPSNVPVLLQTTLIIISS